jgi:predicted MFS family arabinose efflux permease
VSNRRTALTLVAWLALTAFVVSAMVPLLPRFVDEFGLSTVQAGAVIWVVTGLVLVGSVPIGSVADRIGPRPIALAGVAVLGLSCLLQGFASSYPELLVGRIVFGFADVIAWTTAIMWLTHLDVGARRRAILLGGSLTVSAAAFALGPLFVGVTADAIGVWFPFVVCALLAGILLVFILRLPAPPRMDPAERPRLREAASVSRRDPYITVALLLQLVAGGMVIGNALLIPLQLNDNGLSSAQIGAVFSSVGAVGVAVGLAVNRLGERAARPGLGVICLGLLGATTAVPVISASTAALILYLVLSLVPLTVVSTIPYALAGEGALRAEVPPGAVVGGANTAWAISGTLAPLVGGAIAQAFGYRVAWMLVAGAVTTIWLVGVLVTRRLALTAPSGVGSAS